ncbi:hypothetical protein B0H16DRAFT_1463025 [Mycena metata]|uniref:Uncharacterized protein n=1 Tax=Mycena metata TaxID=1033252 RepID=A0AAD7IMS3_9AGAR|nr:hypothetical protein B0H16DRAFT_1463025 [Mycena metata]
MTGSTLRDFIKQSQSSDPQPTPPQPNSHPTRVKVENDASDAFPARPLSTEPVKTRILREGTHEVLEILSDSESEMEFDAANESEATDSDRRARARERPQKNQTPSEISSTVQTGVFEITQEVTVQRIEYLTEIASLDLVPEVSTAFVIDFQRIIIP